MTVQFVVESGAGTPGANAYCPTAFVDQYLEDHNRLAENGWSGLTTPVKQSYVVNGTTFLDRRWGDVLKGVRSTVIAGRGATGSVAIPTNPLASETVTVGQKTYRFVSALAQENDVLIGADAEESRGNLISAINLGGGGSTVHADTVASYEVTSVEDSGSVLVAARQVGTSGDSIALATDVTGATVTAATLTGGIDYGPQPLEFPRAKLYRPDGRVVIGVPVEVKKATAEYAVLSAATVDTLDPDPVYSTSGMVKREKVGPLEVEYVDGIWPRQYWDHPKADRLMRPFVVSGGGVIR